MITRADILTEARRFIGARWQHQGRSLHAVDCAGLVIRVAHNLALTTFDTRDYARRPDSYEMIKLLDTHMKKIKTDGQPGDVLLLSFQNVAQHLAILSDKGMIHAYAHARKVVEVPLGDWKNKIVDIYEFPGVTG